MNNFSPLVSIVIPVYNGANYLAEAIDSALAQTYPNIEILVINDGSKDDGATRNIALGYGDRIRYFEKENGGVATALNLGIEKMKGEYFSWLSHDDKYLPDKIEKQVNFLSGLIHKDVVLYSDLEYIDRDSQTISTLNFPHYSPEDFRPAFIRDGIINGCTLLVPGICFEKCGVFKPELRTTQDYDLWFRISEKFEFIHQKDSLIYSRIHENQDTITLKTTAVNEKDNLHLYFLTNISDAEIVRFSKGNPAGYYLTFARYMESAGCRNAQKLVFRKALNLIFKSSFLITVQNILKLIRLISFIAVRRFIINHFNIRMLKRFKNVYLRLGTKQP